MRASSLVTIILRLGLAGLLLSLAACSSSSGPDIASDQTQLPTHAVAWDQLEQHPGIAGQDYDPRRILVSYKPGASLPAGWSAAMPGAAATAASQPNAILRQDKSYEALTDALAVRYGLTIRQQVYMGSVIFASFELPAGADGARLLARIRKDAASFIEAAVFSPLKHSSFTPNDPFFLDPQGDMWSHYAVNCPAAWDSTSGNPSIIVAVVDTGVNAHSDLGQQVINPSETYPAANCDVANNDKTVEDLDGHGTFIAGIVAATGNNFTDGAGVAYNCRVLPIKISNAGDAPVDDTVAGALLADQLGAQVINYSWGGSDNVPIEQNMVNTVVGNGTLFVCAAGNDGVSTDEYPSAFSAALSVGASNSFNFRADFSNWGASTDIAAPGEGLLGCAHDDFFGYYYIDGTSFAAPMVAAAAGLLLSLDATLTVQELRDALEDNGPAIGGFTNPIKLLDIKAAMDALLPDIDPSITGLSPFSGSTVGAVTASATLNAHVIGHQEVTRVEYRLDLAPLGSAGPEDLTGLGISPASGFQEDFDISTLHNQMVRLEARYFSASEDSGTAVSEPIWIFNQRGDVDGDGIVGPADLAALTPLLGTQQGGAGYLRYADSDLDGKISEADAAAVGYFYGIGAPVPIVNSVSPLSGSTGASVSFSADISAAGQLEYLWDFGTAADPPESAQPAPTVTLGPVGNYACSLTVSTGLRSTTYDFNLNILARSAPSAVLEAAPATGQPPLMVEFDASASEAPGGSIELYEWSWDGDAVYEDSTTAAQNSHLFETAGEYTVRLRVTDDLNSSSEATKLIKVLDSIQISGWNELILGDFGTGSFYPFRFAGGMVGGCPAVIWSGELPGDDTDTVMVARAKVAAPESLSDWVIEPVYTGAAFASVSICDIEGEAAFIFNGEDGITFGQYSDDTFALHQTGFSSGYYVLANIGGKPAMLGGNPKIQYVTSSKPRPTAETDWSMVELDGLPTLTNPPTPSYLLEIGGRPCFVRTDTHFDQIIFGRATTDAPGSADWALFLQPSPDGLDNDARTCLVDFGGRPAVFCNVDPLVGPWELRCAVAQTDAPALDTDWAIHQPVAIPDTSDLGAAAVIDGIPWLYRTSSQSVDLYYSFNGSPSSPADWQAVEIADDQRLNFVILNHGGLPAFLCCQNQGSVIYRYPVP